MDTVNDLWEKLGTLSDDESSHVLTRLFSVYEELFQHDSQSVEAKLFFERLSRVVSLCQDCNLNRR